MNETEVKKLIEEHQAKVERELIAFQENWEHARHVENERMYFAQIFGAVVAGVLAIEGLDFLKPNIPVFGILYLIGMVGFLLTVKFTFEFKNHMDKIQSILDNDCILKDNVTMPLDFDIFQKIKARILFLVFYILICSFLLWVILTSELWIIVLIQIAIMTSIIIIADIQYKSPPADSKWEHCRKKKKT